MSRGHEARKAASTRHADLMQRSSEIETGSRLRPLSSFLLVAQCKLFAQLGEISLNLNRDDAAAKFLEQRVGTARPRAAKRKPSIPALWFKCPRPKRHPHSAIFYTDSAKSISRFLRNDFLVRQRLTLIGSQTQ